MPLFISNLENQSVGYVPKLVLQHRIQAVKPLLKGWVLDIAAGDGQLAQFVSADKYVGVEVDEFAVEQARKQLPHHQFLSSIPETGAFDTIVALSFVEHLHDPKDLLRKFYPILAKDGRVIFTTPQRWTSFIFSVMATMGMIQKRKQDSFEFQFTYRLMQQLALQTGYVLEVNRSFLYGTNQIFVLKKL